MTRPGMVPASQCTRRTSERRQKDVHVWVGRSFLQAYVSDPCIGSWGGTSAGSCRRCCYRYRRQEAWLCRCGFGGELRCSFFVFFVGEVGLAATAWLAPRLLHLLPRLSDKSRPANLPLASWRAPMYVITYPKEA